jgi:DNA-binding XRE family transcriptional regulator
MEDFVKGTAQGFFFFLLFAAGIVTAIFEVGSIQTIGLAGWQAYFAVGFWNLTKLTSEFLFFSWKNVMIGLFMVIVVCSSFFLVFQTNNVKSGNKVKRSQYFEGELNRLDKEINEKERLINWYMTESKKHKWSYSVTIRKLNTEKVALENRREGVKKSYGEFLSSDAGKEKDVGLLWVVMAIYFVAEGALMMSAYAFSIFWKPKMKKFLHEAKAKVDEIKEEKSKVNYADISRNEDLKIITQKDPAMDTKQEPEKDTQEDEKITRNTDKKNHATATRNDPQNNPAKEYFSYTQRNAKSLLGREKMDTQRPATKGERFVDATIHKIDTQSHEVRIEKFTQDAGEKSRNADTQNAGDAGSEIEKKTTSEDIEIFGTHNVQGDDKVIIYGERFKALREAQSHSQKSFSDLLGVSERTIQNIEGKAKYLPGEVTLKKIQRFIRKYQRDLVTIKN